MAAKGIHHLGLAVDDLDEAISTYERLLRRRAGGARDAGRAGRRGGLAPGRPEPRRAARRARSRHAGRPVPRPPRPRHAPRRLRGRRPPRRARAPRGRGRRADRRRPRGPGSSGCRSRSSTPMPPTASSRSWSPVAERIRIEIGFDGGQIMGARRRRRGRRPARAGARVGRGRLARPRRRGRPLHGRAAADRVREAVLPRRPRRLRRVASAVALEVGIVGLPGAGATQLFNALTHAGAQPRTT